MTCVFDTTDSTDHLLVHTLSLVKCCGLFLAKCRVLEGTLTGKQHQTVGWLQYNDLKVRNKEHILELHGQPILSCEFDWAI